MYETISVPTVDTMISTFGKVYKTIPFEDIIASTNIWNTARKKKWFWLVHSIQMN
nr:hypothetical protein [Flavobacterium piscinae]